MAFSKSFERELDKMFRQRTHWLRSELGKKKAGQPPVFGRKKVDKAIDKLQRIASDALAQKTAKSEFYKHVAFRKNRRVFGRGVDEKKREFEKWFSATFRKSIGVVYSFWGEKGKCIYVGRTGSGGSRPSSHFDKFWFSSVKRTTIYAVSSKSQLPKLECLAIHSLQPIRNKNKASTKKWTKACPLCKTHKYIENELRSIFRFK